jgi:hypothetical protein
MSHDEAAIGKLVVDTIQLIPTSNTAPTVTASGAIFVSGGALYYKSHKGSYEELAAE